MVAITPTERVVRCAYRVQPSRLAPTALVALGLALIVASRVLAHDPGLSSVDVVVGPERLTVTLSLAAADAEIIGGPAKVGQAALDALSVKVDGETLRGSVQGLSVDEGNTLHVRLTYGGRAGAMIVMRSSMPARLGPGHKELAAIRTASGSTLAERMLDAQANEIVANAGGTSERRGATAARFAILGVEHILTGYDHLLFLAALLVVARRWSDVIKTITAFTVAHSITLALAALNAIVVPASVVEPLIAASVIYVGLENLLRPIPGSRWKVTFAFGLVHGLGFATILADLGIGTAGASFVVPLASFNAGIEIGQIGVAAALMSIFWKLDMALRTRLQFATIWSVLVVAAGGYWLIERMA
jgi:hydrogenase/urease accessory protein HupE